MNCCDNIVNYLSVSLIVVGSRDNPLQFVVKDLTTHANPSVIKGVFTVYAPNGSVQYHNDNFTLPDIDRSATDTATLQGCCVLSSIKGQWKVVYTISDGVDTYCQTFYYSSGFEAPSPCINFIMQCQTASLKAEDLTKYDGINATTTTEESYSLSLDSKQISPIISTSTIAEAAYPNLYNEEYTANITASHLYVFSSVFGIRWLTDYDKTYLVECYTNLCNYVACIACLREEAMSYEKTNPTRYRETLDKFLYASGLLAEYNAAYDCGNLSEANKIGKEIEDFTQCNNGCEGCGCNNPNQVVPKIIPCNGTCPPCDSCCPTCPACDSCCPPCPPTNPCNTLITEQGTGACPPNYDSNLVTYTLAANQICNPSQVVAQNYAQVYFDATKQAYWDANNVCTPNCVFEGGTVGMGEVCCAGLVQQGSTCQTSCDAGFIDSGGICIPDCVGNGGTLGVGDVCCAGLVQQGSICQTSCDAGYTPDVNGVCQLNLAYQCNQNIDSGGAGTFTADYPLDPNGGTILFVVSAFDAPDTFELTVDGNVVAGSGYNTNAASFGVPASPIGTNLGAVPSRQAEFELAHPNVFITTLGYQQIIWWDYTPADYTASVSKMATFTVNATGNTIWKLKRTCLDNPATCGLEGQAPIGGLCCDGLILDTNTNTCVRDCQGGQIPYQTTADGQAVCITCPEGITYLNSPDGSYSVALCCTNIDTNPAYTQENYYPYGTPLSFPCCSPLTNNGGNCEAPSCAVFNGVDIVVSYCDDAGQKCEQHATGTGNIYTGAIGTVNYAGCEAILVGGFSNCVPMPDGESYPPC